MKIPDVVPASLTVNEGVERVADAVYRVTLPVPFRALRNVNGYLLRGPEGWDVVDTGLKTPEALALWNAAFAELGIVPADLRQVILTHHHPDHVGLAGHFQQAAQESAGRPVPVRISAREYAIIAIIWGTQRRERNRVMEAFFTRCGVPDPAGTNFSHRELEAMRHMLTPTPDLTDDLTPGETVTLGARRFEIVHTPGHSDGHLIFYDPADGLLLVGDHVLPHITPNISFWPGVEPDPLGRYLKSLDNLKTLDVRRALPGHGAAIDGWKERLSALAVHHADRLDAMRHAVGHGATVFDVSRKVFQLRALDRHQVRMAVTETLAHLDHLTEQGYLRRHDDEAWWYEPV